MLGTQHPPDHRHQHGAIPPEPTCLTGRGRRLLGTVIGLGFAWVGYEAFVTRALSDATMQVPWLSLVIVVLIAALAGLLAAVLPARRAARVTPAAGLSLA